MSDGGVERPERRRGGWRNRARWFVRVVAGELHPERNRYRDFVVLVLVVVMTWAVLTAVSATDTAQRATATAHRALAQVQEGRSTSIGVICAVESAIGEAGKATITGGGVLPPVLDVFLQSHGYPPPKVRQRAATRAATRYVDLIGSHIARELRQRGKSPQLVKRLVRRDGTINCRELQRIANVHVR